jgi:hypothetical protein
MMLNKRNDLLALSQYAGERKNRFPSTSAKNIPMNCKGMGNEWDWLSTNISTRIGRVDDPPAKSCPLILRLAPRVLQKVWTNLRLVEWVTSPTSQFFSFGGC